MRNALLALLALALGLAAAACGDTLIDHSGTRFIAPDGGTQCSQSQVVCDVAGVATCTAEDAGHCGTACQSCPVPQDPNAVAACLGEGTPAHGQCGFECTGGLLKCGAACCTATALAAGDAHTCALLSDGSVRCWGQNGSGQTGAGAISTAETFPVAPGLPATPTSIALAAGKAHTCAVLSDGSVRCWGADDQGQVSGAPSAAPVLSPAPSPAATPVTTALAVAAGAGHTCALLATGAVTCWGASDQGQTGGGAPIASGAAALSAGANHTCAATASGAVLCWGSNASAQLGNGTVGGSSPTPVTTIASGYPMVAAGGGHACAAKSSNPILDDWVVCWGDAPGTAFGLGEPQLVPAIPLKAAGQSTIRFAVSALATGRTHTCVIRQAEDVQCFGPDNAWGQLGGTRIAISEAVSVANSLLARAVAAGADHTCAVWGDGSAKCWGANHFGQLGNGLVRDPTPGAGVIVSVSGR